MTSTVPRRLFDDMAEEYPPEILTKEFDLKAKGLIRSSLIIPIEQNERLKAMARKHGKNTDQLIGELHMEFVASKVDEWEARQEAARLRKRFGDNWLKLLQEAG